MENSWSFSGRDSFFDRFSGGKYHTESDLENGMETENPGFFLSDPEFCGERYFRRSIFAGSVTTQGSTLSFSVFLWVYHIWGTAVSGLYNLHHKSGTVQHLGDNLTGEGDGDDEQIVVDLSKIPAEYDRIVIVVNIYHAVQRKQHFGMIENAFIRLVDGKNNREMCKYDLSEDYSDMTAMIFGEVYRHDGEWKFNAIGQGTKDPGIAELATRYK